MYSGPFQHLLLRLGKHHADYSSTPSPCEIKTMKSNSALGQGAGELCLPRCHYPSKPCQPLSQVPYTNHRGYCSGEWRKVLLWDTIKYL